MGPTRRIELALAFKKKPVSTARVRKWPIEFGFPKICCFKLVDWCFQGSTLSDRDENDPKVLFHQILNRIRSTDQIGILRTGDKAFDLSDPRNVGKSDFFVPIGSLDTRSGGEKCECDRI